MKPGEDILINLCGRGDKDMPQVARILGHDIKEDFISGTGDH